MLGCAQCIAFVSFKGGTGKTTSCLSIGGYLAKNSSRVLVVDFDSQADATSGLGIDITTLKYSMYDAVLNQCDGYEGVPVTEVILETDLNNLHVAPSELDLAVAEVLMQQTDDRATILNRTLDKVRPFYDYILIDLPPSSGLLTVNGLSAADHVIVPLDPSIYSLEALENLKSYFSDIQRMAGHYIDQVTVLLIRYLKPGILSGIFGKSCPSREVERKLREMSYPLFTIPEAADIYETQKKGVPISHYRPQSKVGKAYEQIARNIMTHRLPISN